MTSSSPIRAYVINLDRSPERLEAVRASAAVAGIEVVRVAAVDGATIDIEGHGDVDVAAFRRVNGRPIIPGEVGCYFSHLRALATFLESREEVGLICEDDVAFTEATMPFVTHLAASDDWDVVKLYSFRYRGFVAHRRIDGGAIGRCIHGPVGSSAAYAVTRRGARRLLATLTPMIVPYDVALERGWNGNVAFFMTDHPVIALQPARQSTIVAQGGYRRAKFPFYRRIGTLLFRASEYSRRIHFALSRSAKAGG